MIQRETVTAGDLYASAASASQHGREQLAAELEKIADDLAARRPLVGYVWACPVDGCAFAGMSATPQRSAEQYVEHYNAAHAAVRS